MADDGGRSEGARTPPRADGPSWWFPLLCGAGFGGRLSYEMIRSPLTALYAWHLGAPTTVIGLLVAAVTITGIFVKLPAGSLADQFGFRRLMLAGMMVTAVGPFLYLLVWFWPQLLAVRFFHGLSTALYAPAASAQVAKSFPSQRGRRLGLYGAAENAGVVLGPVIGAVALAHLGFAAAFVVSGGIGLLALLTILPFPRDVPVHDGRRSTGEVLRVAAEGVRQIIGDPAIRLVSLIEAALYFGVGTLQAYLPLYAQDQHIPILKIGFLFGAQGIASILFRPVFGVASDRVGRRPFVVAGIGLCATVLATIPYMGQFLPLLGLSTLFGLGTAMVTPATTAMIGDIVRSRDFGAAMGVFGSLWDAGHACGPLMAGVFIALIGYRSGFMIIAGVMVTVLVVFLCSNRKSPAKETHK